jgi:hypothetical protein
MKIITINQLQLIKINVILLHQLLFLQRFIPINLIKPRRIYMINQQKKPLPSIKRNNQTNKQTINLKFNKINIKALFRSMFMKKIHNQNPIIILHQIIKFHKLLINYHHKNLENLFMQRIDPICINKIMIVSKMKNKDI